LTDYTVGLDAFLLFCLQQFYFKRGKNKNITAGHLLIVIVVLKATLKKMKEDKEVFLTLLLRPEWRQCHHSLFSRTVD